MTDEITKAIPDSGKNIIKQFKMTYSMPNSMNKT